MSVSATLVLTHTFGFGTQIVSQYSSILAPIAVDSVKRLATESSTNVDLRDIRIVKKVGGTIDDTELVDGVALNQNVNTAAGGPTRIEKAKIGLIQFQLSAPKPDVGPLGCLCERVSPPMLTWCRAVQRLSCRRWTTRSSSTTTGKWTRSSRRSASTC